jgi:hypothetical protein
MNWVDAAKAIRAGSEPIYWVSIAHIAALPIVAGALLLDSRLILGISPWIKPLKFLLSGLIFLVTIGWLLRELDRPSAAWIGWVVAIAMAVENVLIGMQSASGVTSHFNGATAFDAAVFSAMGTFIAINTVAVAALLVLFFTGEARLSPGYLWGIRLGLLIFLLGSLQSGLMLRIEAHTVGAADGGPGLPFLNWSTRFGDLRIGHFVGLHAIQALPIVGWLLDRGPIPNAALLVGALAAIWFALFIAVTLQALAGKPLWF